MRRLFAAVAAAGVLTALAPVADASIPCRYYIIAGRVIRVCPPALPPL